MGRPNSSNPTLDGQPQQHFRGSHVTLRDQVGSRSGIRVRDLRSSRSPTNRIRSNGYKIKKPPVVRQLKMPEEETKPFPASLAMALTNPNHLLFNSLPPPLLRVPSHCLLRCRAAADASSDRFRPRGDPSDGGRATWPSIPTPCRCR
ncbi:hypothetical protein GW17_00013660 [Ensete ventricosum]|nr:hypothetical protein GW17_00013660 [Ensete ventricosum]